MLKFIEFLSMMAFLTGVKVVIIMVKYHLVAQEKLSEDCAVSFALLTIVTCHPFVMGPGVIVFPPTCTFKRDMYDQKLQKINNAEMR